MDKLFWIPSDPLNFVLSLPVEAREAQFVWLLVVAQTKPQSLTECVSCTPSSASSLGKLGGLELLRLTIGRSVDQKLWDDEQHLTFCYSTALTRAPAAIMRLLQ